MEMFAVLLQEENAKFEGRPGAIAVGGMKLTSQRRHLRLTGRASIAKMSTERQRLSFFLVLIFLAVFGLIVLAEVFFVDKEVLGGKARYKERPSTDKFATLTDSIHLL